MYIDKINIRDQNVMIEFSALADAYANETCM